MLQLQRSGSKRATGPALTARDVLRLQRSIGNAATVARLQVARRAQPDAVGTSARPNAVGRRVQRDPDASVSVVGVRLSATKVSVPPEAGLSLKASAQPSNATGVTFSIDKGSVSPTGISIDASTGVITLASGQQGGTVKIKAAADDGSSAWQELQMVEKPTSVASTSASAQGGSVYGGQFTHTFSDASGSPSGLQGENINEKFDSTSVKSPFGPFSLKANPAGAHGWDLDASGTMAGPDNVTIDRAGVDIGKFISSASNPSPAQALPAGFTMTQHMRARSFPSGKMDAAPFTDIDHVRTLNANAKFVVSAGAQSLEDDYTGPPAYTGAAAAPASVSASPPKPKAAKGAPAPTWTRNTVQVSANVLPTGGPMVFSIVGPKLGCEIDKATGEVLIGSTPGTIKVRVSAGKGTNFDEVSITITPAPPPPQPTPSSP